MALLTASAGNAHEFQANLKSFGARGDNLHDDSAAIQAALDYIKLNRGTTLYVPRGRYLLKSSVSMRGITNDIAIRIIGEGGHLGPDENGSLFVLAANLASTTTPMFHFDADSTSARIHLEAVGFRASADSPVGTALKIERFAGGVSLQDVVCMYFAGRGVWINRCIGVNLIRVHAERNGTGFYHDGETSVGEGAVIASKFASNTNGNVFLGSGTTFLSFYGCTFYGASTIKGVEINGTNNIYSIGFFHSSFESSTPSILIPATTVVADLIVEGCVLSPSITSGTNAGIYCLGEINNCTIRNNVLAPSVVSGAVGYGIMIEQTANAVIGPNRWNPSGDGTSQELYPSTLGGAITSVDSENLAANRVVISNRDGKLVASSTVSDIELSYLAGVTNALQAQIISKLPRVNGTAHNVTLSGTSINEGSLKSTGPILVGSTAAPNTKLDVNGDFALRRSDVVLANGSNTSVATPTSFIKVTGPSASFTIHGLMGGADGKMVQLLNVTGQQMTIANLSAIEPDSSNRILTLSGADVTLGGASCASLIWDSEANKWIVMSVRP